MNELGGAGLESGGQSGELTGCGAIDNGAEAEIVTGGVGFDDGETEADRWVRESRSGKT